MITRKVQLDALTGARGIAAWMVVLYHVRLAFADAVPQSVVNILAKGYLAVDLFFIMSGFVMWLNYGECFKRDGLRATPDFLIKRIARIYPLHFVVLSLTTLYAVATALIVHGNPDRYPFDALPLHFLLMQNWGSGTALSWNDPSWSISAELGAYILLPFFVLACRKVKADLPIVILGIAGLCGVMGLVMTFAGSAHMGDHVAQTGLIRCIIEFLIGTLVCTLWQLPHHQRAMIALAIAAIAIFGALGLSGALSEIWVAPVLFAATVFLLAATSASPLNPFSSRILVYLGELSYSTYLWHFLLWIVFKLVFVTDIYSVSLPLMALFVGLTYAASVLSYRFVEDAGRRWLTAILIKAVPHKASKAVSF